jgi:hypothetical protein
VSHEGWTKNGWEGEDQGTTKRTICMEIALQGFGVMNTYSCVFNISCDTPSNESLLKSAVHSDIDM